MNKVKKKIFEGSLSCMGVAAILVMWLRCREQTFVRDSTQNLALIGQADLEKMFERTDGRTVTDAGALEYYKLTWWAYGSLIWWAKTLHTASVPSCLTVWHAQAVKTFVIPAAHFGLYKVHVKRRLYLTYCTNWGNRGLYNNDRLGITFNSF